MLDGQISAGHGRAILAVQEEEGRVKLAKKIASEHLSVREAENLARLFGTQNFERSKRPPSPSSYKYVARKLRQSLNTNVRVKSVRGKNRIEIEFADEEDLQRVYSILDASIRGTAEPAAAE